MRVTQGTFSFLPDLTDEQIEAQIALRAAQRLGDHRSSTPTTRTRATPTGRCGACRCSTSARTRPTSRCARCSACREALPAPLRQGRSPTTRSLRAPDHGAGVHRRPAGRGARLPARAHRQGRPPDPLHAARLRDRHRRHRYAAERPPRRAAVTGRRAPASASTRSTRCSTQLDADLVALQPVKTRIREIAALLVIDRLRREADLDARSRRRCTCASPATRARARRPSRCGWPRSCTGSATSRRATWSSVTRDDLVGQYVGHTAPKTKDVLKRAYGGVLFIDEAYYLHRPENERDYGQEAIEILLQVMETERDQLVVILAGYKDRMDDVLRVQPRHGLAGRAPHRLPRLRRRRADGDRAALMLERQDYALVARGAQQAFREYLERRIAAAALRARAQHPQRDRPRPAAPGQPPLRPATSRPGTTS